MNNSITLKEITDLGGDFKEFTMMDLVNADLMSELFNPNVPADKRGTNMLVIYENTNKPFNTTMFGGYGKDKLRKLYTRGEGITDEFFIDRDMTTSTAQSCDSGDTISAADYYMVQEEIIDFVRKTMRTIGVFRNVYVDGKLAILLVLPMTLVVKIKEYLGDIPDDDDDDIFDTLDDARVMLDVPNTAMSKWFISAHKFSRHIGTKTLLHGFYLDDDKYRLNNMKLSIPYGKVEIYHPDEDDDGWNSLRRGDFYPTMAPEFPDTFWGEYEYQKKMVGRLLSFACAVPMSDMPEQSRVDLSHVVDVIQDDDDDVED